MWHFGGPLVITVSVPKGGRVKTWTAFNLGSTLGMWGYKVVVVDSNAQHDCWADAEYLATQGITPRFEVVQHDPLDADGNQAELPNLEPYRDAQFLIYDTSQYLQLRSSKWSWQHCHAMILVTSPQMSEVRNYLTAIHLYQHLPGERGPLIVLPCMARVLHNSTVQREFNKVLEELEKQGCVIPRIGGELLRQNEMIPESELMSLQSTRWIWDETVIGGAKKRVSDDFIRRVVTSMTWIRFVLESTFGHFPAPRLPVLTPDPVNREFIIDTLRKEFQQRRSKEVAPETLTV